ncbi:hypothetical protein [Catalinimonas niigatensis]|uniref:hypothetical protein n=1 Tax=Catalinimonas niigatensis TaxID=1397264 RepID=UPI00266622A0|nr:hypothetical protein [Catalinimonas niigatensis]WPP52018.1 hypothetical protein PZB72_06435 [Catalinimonas niigatensis]
MTQSICLLVCLGIYSRCFSQDTVIEVPLTSVKGYSVFHPSFASKVEEPAEDVFKEDLSGIPLELNNPKRFHIVFNEKQFYYQQYLSGKLSEARYHQMKEMLKWEEPNEQDYSKKTISASVYLLVGENESGQKVWMADTDLDHDFSEEEAKPLLSYGADTYKAIAKNAVEIKAQRVEKKRIVEAAFPLTFVEGLEKDTYLFNHPLHYSATLHLDNKPYEIKINREGFIFFHPENSNSEMVVMNDSLEGKVMDIEGPVSESQYFTINDITFEYLGIDVGRNIATFREVLKKRTYNLHSLDQFFHNFQERIL